MKAYLVRRGLVALPSLFVVTALVFVATRVLPGDPAVLLAGDFATPETVAALRAKWGLDRPVPVQYAVFLAHLVRGDLGTSIVSDLPVLDEILQRFRVTLTLAAAAIAVAVAVGLSAGVLGATRPYSGWDYGGMVLAMVGVSERVVVDRHALRNALVPVVTVVGLEFGRLLGGAVLTETVFSMPGLGSFLVVSIFKRDYPVIQGIVLWLALSFVLLNVLVDVLYAALDPRVRYA